MPEAEKAEHKIEVIKPISITPKEYALNTEFSVLNEPLGAIVIAFSELEAQLTMAINALLNLEYRDGIVLEDLMQSFATRRKLFCSLAAIKSTDPLKKEVGKKGGLNSRLLECNDYRNDLIHGPWTTIYADGSFGKVRYRADVGGLHPIESLYRVSVEDMWKAHQEIFACGLEVATWRFVFNHRDKPELWPPSWRDKMK